VSTVNIAELNDLRRGKTCENVAFWLTLHEPHTMGIEGRWAECLIVNPASTGCPHGRKHRCETYPACAHGQAGVECDLCVETLMPGVILVRGPGRWQFVCGAPCGIDPSPELPVTTERLASVGWNCKAKNEWVWPDNDSVEALEVAAVAAWPGSVTERDCHEGNFNSSSKGKLWLRWYCSPEHRDLSRRWDAEAHERWKRGLL
jgi:hypothetical protein